jgi:putative endopeptidase
LSSIVFAGDVSINGLLCTAETIADLGAVACILDIVDDDPAASLSTAMESWASIWAARLSPELSVYLLYMDSHLPNKARANFILSQMDVFYEIFGITESDGMYILEEARHSIW